MNQVRSSCVLAVAAVGMAGFVVAGAARAASPESRAAESGAAARFDIMEFDIDGNSVLDEATIYEAIAPFTGPDRSVDDVDKARAALESAYQQRGYKTVSVTIPRQSQAQVVGEGVVLLQVNEARVGHLNVIGSNYHSIDQVRQEAPSLAEGKVPDFDQVQTDLAALNQQADRKVTPALKAGASPGTVDVDLVVDDHLPLHGSAEVNNRRSQDTTELRVVGSLSYDNLWQQGHSLSVSYQTAPQRQSDARVFFGSYLWRFGASPYSLLFNGLNSDSDVATVGGTDVVGSGRSFGVRGVYQFDGADGFYPSVSFGVDYKRFKTRIGLGSASFDTPVEYVPFTLSLSALLRKTSFISQGDASLVFASPAVGSERATIDANRFRANGQAFHFRANLSHTQELPLGAQGFLRLSGQLADRPLISNEQLSAGGADTVRGYLEAAALGDYGFSGTFELRTPSLLDQFAIRDYKVSVQDFRFYVFLDGADLRLINSLPDVRRRETLLSFGGGLNLKLLSHLDGSVEWAEPILSQSATRAFGGRVLFRVSTSF